MNHKFINALVELYNELPETTPELAARRVAVLIDNEIECLEKKGIPITREKLISGVQESIEEHKKVA